MPYDLSVLVPVYNECETVLQLLSRLVNAPALQAYQIQVIVVDDGSTDGTASVLKGSPFATDPRFVWLQHEKNLGKGSAIRTALQYSSGTFTVIQDADLEYDPNDLGKLLSFAKQNSSGVVYGSRNLNPDNNKGGLPFYWGGKGLSWLANLLYGLRLTDEPTCYKLFRTDILKSLPLTCQRFEFCPEVTALLAKRGIKIPEVPISYAPRDKRSGKKINFRDGCEAIWTLLRLRFNKTSGYIIFALMAAGIVFLRKPETLLHPQLWAEDGKIWLAQAYNLGAWRSLLISDGGYFQTFPRIFAGLGTLLPLHLVPLLFNVAEFVLQVSVALLIVSGRLRQIIPKLGIRLILAGFYLLLPNTAELDGHLTSGQWFLGLSLFLVLIAAPPLNKWWRIYDYIVLIVGGLTGIFAIFLTPIAALLWWSRRTSQSLVNLIIITLAAAAQALSVFFLASENRLRLPPPGLTGKLMLDIFDRQVIWGFLSGAKGYLLLFSHAPWPMAIVYGISLLSIGLMIYALIKAPLALKLFILFGSMIFLATMFTPTKSNLSYDVFHLFAYSTDGIRYWFIPMLSFVTVLVWGATVAKPRVIKILSLSLLYISILGIILDFRHQPYPDTNFDHYVERFTQLRSGENLTIPITPPGWEMRLIKH